MPTGVPAAGAAQEGAHMRVPSSMGVWRTHPNITRTLHPQVKHRIKTRNHQVTNNSTVAPLEESHSKFCTYIFLSPVSLGK